MELAAFEGLWTLSRVIEDFRASARGVFRGRAWLTRCPEGLDYREEGELILGAGPAMTASRRYLWRAGPGGIMVDFADGRFFHAFDPCTPAPEAAHFCDPDHYAARYDFARWPEWRAQWRVTGPRKDYRMISDYRRAEGAADGPMPACPA